MKKILLVLFFISSVLCFTEDIVIYYHDVATGETIDRGVKKSQIDSAKQVLKKIERYKELRAKKSLTGAEIEEMSELKDYIISVNQRLEEAERQKMQRETMISEQEVINNISRKPTEEEMRKAIEDQERKKQESSETVMGSFFKKILN